MDCSLPGFTVHGILQARLPCPPPVDLPDPRIKPTSLTSPELVGVSLPLVPPQKPVFFTLVFFFFFPIEIPVLFLFTDWKWNPLWPHGLWPARLLWPWNSLGKKTEVDCHFLLQGIFPIQGLIPGHLHWQVDSLLSEPPAAAAAKLLQSCMTLCNPRDLD